MKQPPFDSAGAPIEDESDDADASQWSEQSFYQRQGSLAAVS
jgi:hypothetical protein